MILFLLIQALVFAISLIFAPFPVVDQLPWGMDAFFSSGIGYFRYLMDFFPPFSTVLTAFVVYIGVKVAIIVLTFFLGSRTPVKH